MEKWEVIVHGTMKEHNIMQMRSLKSVAPVKAYPGKSAFSEKEKKKSWGGVHCDLYIESFEKNISIAFKGSKK